MITILDTLKALDEARGSEIEQWFAAQRKTARPYIYSSVDLRHSSHKIAPVDTNLFPAGFNNLSPVSRIRATNTIRDYIAEFYPNAKRMVIIPENHTRNLGYLENLATLLSIIEAAGLDVQLGSLAAPSGQPVELESPSGRKLIQYPLGRDGDKLILENNFTPDLILLNNDMTAGSPELLANLSQPILPPVAMGWYQRRKSVHFAAYRTLVNDFCTHFSLDPWLLAAEFHQCGFVDFKERTGLDCVAKGIDEVLVKVREKYAQYGIADKPYVFIKADSGTYGMGIMTVESSEEIFEMNKKERNKMQVIKEGTHVSEVIIQEGIPTIDRVADKAAEPMIYMVDGIPVGGMFRVNGQRDDHANLNASGMEFTGMCGESEELSKDWKKVDNCHFRSFGVVAAIAALAAAREDYSRIKPVSLAACCG